MRPAKSVFIRRAVWLLALGLLGLVVASAWWVRPKDHSRRQSRATAAIKPETTQQTIRPRFGSTAQHQQPDWVLSYGYEFWRESEPSSDSGATPSLSLSSVMERAGNAFIVRDDDTAPTARAYTHRTTLTESGVRFYPYEPSRHQAMRLADELVSTADFASRSEVSGWANGLGERAEYNEELAAEWSLERVALGEEQHTRVGPWEAYGNTAQRRVHIGPTEVLEHIESRDYGVERTWLLLERPEIDGALEIETGVVGLSAMDVAGDGTYYADARGIARAHIGTPVLVDASGARTALEADTTATGIRYVVPETLLASSTYPVAIDPVIASVFTVDTPVGANGGAQTGPNAARTANNEMLVVWEDARSSTSAVYAARVTESHVVKDPWGILLGDGHRPRVDCGSSSAYDCAVVYSAREQYALGIRARRVNSTLGTLAAEVDVVAPGYIHHDYADVVHVDDGWLFAWEGWSGQDLNISARSANESLSYFGTRYVVDGGSGDQQRVRLSAAHSGATLSSYALAVWEDTTNGNAEIALLNQHGQVQNYTYGHLYDEQALRQEKPDVAYPESGDTALVSWIERDHGVSRVLCSRVTPTEQHFFLILNRSPCASEIDTEQTVGVFKDVSVSERSSGGWLLSWQFENAISRSEIFARTVNSHAGMGSRYSVSGLTGSSELPSSVCTGSACSVLWQRDSGGSAGTDVYIQKLASSGAPTGNESPVLPAGFDQWFPRIAATSTRALVVWEDFRNGSEVYGALLDTTGGAPSVSGPGFLVHSPSVEVIAFDVAAIGPASGADRFLVVHTNAPAHPTYAPDTTIVATPVSAAGAVGTGRTVIPSVASGSLDVRVAPNGSNMALVVAGQVYYGPILAQRVSDTGQRVGETTALPGSSAFPDVAGTTDTAHALVSFGDFDVDSSRNTVKATEYLEGTAGETYAFGVEQPYYSRTNAEKAGRSYLVSWAHPSLDVVKIPEDGDPEPYRTIAHSNNQGVEFLASDGHAFLVGYQPPDDESVLLGQFLGASGSACASSTTLIENTVDRKSLWFKRSSAVAYGPGRYLVTYEQRNADGVYEVRVMDVRESPDADLDMDGDGVTVCGGDLCDNVPGRSQPEDEIVADGIDQDCDGGDLCYADLDNDDIGTDGQFYSDSNLDCSDGTHPFTASVAGDNCPNDYNPGQEDLDQDGEGDVCDSDTDNDGFEDEGDVPDNCPRAANPDQRDLDEDGLGDACDSDADGDGLQALGDLEEYDCDDLDPYVLGPDYHYPDADQDTFGDDIDASVLNCGGPGWSTNRLDCDDGNRDIHPYGLEIPGNDSDEDCNASWQCLRDQDGDSHFGLFENDAPCGTAYPITVVDDCDDGDALVNPAATEIVGNEVDEDCSGTVHCYADADGDGFGSGETVESSDSDCNDIGEAIARVDCDDTPVSGAFIGSASLYYPDSDRDGFGDSNAQSLGSFCLAPPDAADNSLDCNDGDSAVGPTAHETCGDGVDSNCDGYADRADCHLDACQSITGDPPSLYHGGVRESDPRFAPDSGRPAALTVVGLYSEGTEVTLVPDENLHVNFDTEHLTGRVAGRFRVVGLNAPFGGGGMVGDVWTLNLVFRRITVCGGGDCQPEPAHGFDVRTLSSQWRYFEPVEATLSSYSLANLNNEFTYEHLFELQNSGHAIQFGPGANGHSMRCGLRFSFSHRSTLDNQGVPEFAGTGALILDAVAKPGNEALSGGNL